MTIDEVLDDPEAQPGNDLVFHLFPHEFGIGFFGFHGFDPRKWNVENEESRRRKKCNTESTEAGAQRARRRS